MGRLPYKGPGEKYEIEKIQEWHKEILRLALLGYREKDIAVHTGYSVGQISNIFNSPIFQEQLQILQAARDEDSISVSKRILELAPVALERIKEVLTVPIYRVDGNEVKVDERIDPSLKVKVAADILDRAGHKAVDKKIVAHLTKEELDDMKKEALEAGIKDGYVVDAEEVEVVESDQEVDNEPIRKAQ